MQTIRDLVSEANRRIRRHGVRKAVCAAVLKCLDHYARFNVLQVLYADEVNPSLLECPSDYSGGFLPPRVLDELARDPAVPAESIRYSLAKGDKCFGFIRDGALRAYSWYAATPTRVSPELRVHFSANYIYMYRAATREADRGRRLFAIGVTRALKHYLAAGYRGMLVYVDAHKLESLKSCARMGFRRCGTIYIAKFLGRHFIWHTAGCAHFRFRIEREDVSGSKPIADRVRGFLWPTPPFHPRT
jgi:hypothetical protein